MVDHYPSLPQTQTTTRPSFSSSLLRKLRERVSTSNQLLGIFTLLITGAILLFLTGLTIIAAILGLIIFLPIIIVLSPIWVPICAVVFIITTTFLSMCGFGVVAVAMLTWTHRYFRGLNPTGSDRVNRVKDYGGHLQSKVVMDAAPGA
ncbi:hypothetical protein RJT34_15318 [Clitoria ternatea]|uniref:Oleosin n=1 Tax=Clitoria ternatea TaxID=43366 RepID=A0AAN9JTT3_CLITE